MHIIHISWAGPFSPEKVSTRSDTERGLYQIYSHHPVYGHSLVYIGKTTQSFAARIKAEGWLQPGEADPNSIQIYLGELVGQSYPGTDTWDEQIDKAEALLIHAHAPAYNSTYIFNPPKRALVEDVIVRSFGAVRSLSREVSGAVWSEAGAQLRKLTAYKEPPIETEPPLVPID